MSSNSGSNPQEMHREEDRGESSTGAPSGGVRFGGDDERVFCLKCQSRTITYECDPCGHAAFCTDCARKLASGGKCKICGEMYGGLRRTTAQRGG